MQDTTPPDRETDDGHDAGWTPADDAVPFSERLELDDVDLLREVTHPVRGAILRRLRTPRSVADVASMMDVPVTRLYHHVNKLHDLGLIQVVATRQVAAVTERRYQVVARSFSLAPQLFDTLDRTELALALGSLFDVAKLGFQRTVEAGLFDSIDDPESHSQLSLAEIHLPDERRAELMQRLDEIVAEFCSDRGDDDSDANRITMFIAVYPEAT